MGFSAVWKSSLQDLYLGHLAVRLEHQKFILKTCDSVWETVENFDDNKKMYCSENMKGLYLVCEHGAYSLQ